MNDISDDTRELDSNCAGCIGIPNIHGLHTCEKYKGEPYNLPVRPMWADFSTPQPKKPPPKPHWISRVRKEDPVPPPKPKSVASSTIHTNDLADGNETDFVGKTLHTDRLAELRKKHRHLPILLLKRDDLEDAQGKAELYNEKYNDAVADINELLGMLEAPELDGRKKDYQRIVRENEHLKAKLEKAEDARREACDWLDQAEEKIESLKADLEMKDGKTDCYTWWSEYYAGNVTIRELKAELAAKDVRVVALEETVKRLNVRHESEREEIRSNIKQGNEKQGRLIDKITVLETMLRGRSPSLVPTKLGRMFYQGPLFDPTTDQSREVVFDPETRKLYFFDNRTLDIEEFTITPTEDK